MTQVDRALSEQAARRIEAQVSECYSNAYRALLTLPELAGGQYVEGYAVCDGLVLEHGWIELDGRIVDPTLHGRGDVAYFAGPRFTQRQAWKAIEDTGDLPIFYRFGWGGCDSPEMMRAGAAAYASIGSHEIAERYRANAEYTQDGGK